MVSIIADIETMKNNHIIKTGLKWVKLFLEKLENNNAGLTCIIPNTRE